MRTILRVISAAAILCICAMNSAAQSPAPPSSESRDAQQSSPPQSSAFMRKVYLRGTLGDARVQVELRPKADSQDGIEGTYFVFGNSQKILLAGEIEGNDLFLEESENGTDISGQWNGSLNGDIISGNWQSADGAVTKPFSLKVAQVAERAGQP